MILVTGATGTVGAEVVKQLAAAGQPVRALVHSRDKAKSLERGTVQVVPGDFGDAKSVRSALAGIQQLFLLTPADKATTIPALEAPVVDEAKKAGVEHIVKLSVIGCEIDHPIQLGRWHRESEQRIEASGIGWTFLRPNFFMASFAVYLGATIRSEGAFYAPAKDGKISMIDPADIAACAVAAFTKSGHVGKAYALTGCEALSLAAAAEALSRAVRKPIKYVDVPNEAFRAGMLKAGVREQFADAYLEFWDIVKAGYAAGLSPAVEELTGRRPRTLEQWASVHASALR